MLRVALAIVLVLPAMARAACLPYGPASVTLTGTVQHVRAYGPPGFGETPKQDAREDYDGLKVDTPVCTVQSANGSEEAESGVPVLQMLFSGRRPAFRPNQRVTVTGTLFHQDTGHHHTVVLIDVASIQ